MGHDYEETFFSQTIPRQPVEFDYLTVNFIKCSDATTLHALPVD